jgi:hypothetical protein
MFSFCCTILLVSVRTRDMVSYPDFFKEGVKFLIFTTPIGLHGEDFPVKESLSEGLEFSKLHENFRFMLKQIDPCKFTVIINKANIISLSSNGLGCMTPDI